MDMRAPLSLKRKKKIARGLGHQAGLGSECAGSNHGIRGIGVNIHHRRVIQIDAQGPEFDAHRCSDRCAAGRPRCRRTEVCDRRRRPKHGSAFMIDGNEQLFPLHAVTRAVNQFAVGGKPLLIRNAALEIVAKQNNSCGLQRREQRTSCSVRVTDFCNPIRKCFPTLARSAGKSFIGVGDSGVMSRIDSHIRLTRAYRRTASVSPALRDELRKAGAGKRAWLLHLKIGAPTRSMLSLT